jgi:hypothetical protein
MITPAPTTGGVSPNTTSDMASNGNDSRALECKQIFDGLSEQQRMSFMILVQSETQKTQATVSPVGTSLGVPLQQAGRDATPRASPFPRHLSRSVNRNGAVGRSGRSNSKRQRIDSEGDGNNTINDTKQDRGCQPVVIEDLEEDRMKNIRATLKIMKEKKPHLKIKEARRTRAGHLLIIPEDEHTTNSLLGEWVCDGLGTIKGRLPKTQIIEHQIIITGVDHEIMEKEIVDELEKQSMNAKWCKRIISRATGQPTSLVRVSLSEEQDKVQLLNRGFLLEYVKYRCIPPKEDASPATQIKQCWKCQKFDNHSSYNCKGSLACPKCGGDHTGRGCENAPHCANCGGSHRAWDRACPKFLSAVQERNQPENKKSTYAEKVKVSNFMTQQEVERKFSELKQLIALTITGAISNIVEDIISDMTENANIFTKTKKLKVVCDQTTYIALIKGHVADAMEQAEVFTASKVFSETKRTPSETPLKKIQSTSNNVKNNATVIIE